MNKVYFIKGCKWWDKVNGNTYFSAKVYELTKESDYKLIEKIPFQYGYGSQYYHEAKKTIESKYKYKTMKFIDLGAEYKLKKEVKNYMY